MKIVPATLIALLFVLAARPAAAVTWIIGPNLGVDVLRANGSSATIFATPGDADIFYGGMRPGLRFGGLSESGMDEVFLDTGILVLGGEGDTYHSLIGTLNYARLLAVARSAPYLTLGGGFGSVGISGNSTTLVDLGGGFGVRNRLSHGNGAVRVELRYDRLKSNESGSEGINIFGLKVGFDLDLN